MRRFLALAIFLPSLFLLVARPAQSTILIQKFGTVTVGGSPSVEIVGSTTAIFNTVKSASLNFTSDGTTSEIVAGGSFRRNAGQTAVFSMDGVPMTLSTAALAYSFYAGLAYVQNPSAGAHILNLSLSAASDGMSITGLGFSNVGSAPVEPGFNATQSVATASATVTAASAGNILVAFMIKQDTTTSQPILNTSAAVLQESYPQPASVGNAGASGWVRMATLICLAGTNRINWSWTTAANTSLVWMRLTP